MKRSPQLAAFAVGFISILIQRENPAIPVSDECSDAQSEPRSEQGHGKTGGLAVVRKTYVFRDDENLRFSRTGVNRVRPGQLPTHSC